MKKYNIFISSYLFLFLLFFVFPLNVHAKEVNYESEPISFFGSEFIELTDEVDDLAVQAEYNQMMRSTGSSNVSMSSRAYYALMSYTTPAFTLASGLNSDDVYEVQLSFNYSLTPSPAQTDTSLRFRNCHAAFASLLLNSYSNNTLPYSFSGTKTYYLSGETLMASNTCLIRTFITASNALSFTMNINFDIQVDSIKLVSGNADSAYQQGYNAGYSAGENAGYSTGYNAGYSSGYSAGEDAGYSAGENAGYSDGYNSGYNVGYDDGISSVDTQSFYDAGYSSGYNAGYSAGEDVGYSSGYNDGYELAMKRIESWGADSTNYPLLISENNDESFTFSVLAKTSYPLQYEDYWKWTSSYNFNPNHTYMFEVVCSDIVASGSDIFFSEKNILYLDVGGINFLLSNFDGASPNRFYIPGNRMSSAFAFVWRPYLALLGDVMSSDSARASVNLSYKIFDCGPSGDTQNHIANQTDQMMNTPTDNNGKYNSDIDGFNSELDSGISSEEDIMSEQNENINNFEYKPIGEFTGLTSALSFYSAVVASAFTSLGDFQALWVISLTIIVIMVLLRISRGV